MEKMKKLVSILLVLVLAMGMGTTAFAAGGNYTITIKNEVGTHTYEAYQIFKGDLSGDVLSNIKWGTGVTAAGQTALGDAATKAETIKEASDAEEFAKEVAKFLTNVKVISTVSTTVDADKEYTYTIEGLEAGYYLVKDKAQSNLTDGSAYTEYILKVVKDVEVDAKDSSIVVTKKVDDKNDSNASENEINWKDSADHDLGDMIDFKISTTLPGDFEEYTTYKLTLHDKQSAGLTFDPATADVKVFVDGTEVEGGFAVVTTDLEDDCTFEVRFANVRTYEAAKNGSVIDVTYKSMLNENAVMGSAGNPNEVYGEYSNDHYSDETGKTPKDKVIVFTYKVNVDKVTKNDKNENVPLKGAEFTLYKEVVADKDNNYPTGAKTGATLKSELETVNPSIKAGALKDDAYYVEAATRKTDADGDTFDFERIDDGTYVLVETLIPAGYNAWDAAEFEIKATHELDSDNPKLLTLTGGNLFAGEVSTGILDTDIVNNQGSTLPGTGGMGTTLFYIVGAILVIGAGVILVTKKRMNEN